MGWLVETARVWCSHLRGFLPGTVSETVYVHLIPRKDPVRNREIIKSVIVLLGELCLNKEHRDVAALKESADTKIEHKKRNSTRADP